MLSLPGNCQVNLERSRIFTEQNRFERFVDRIVKVKSLTSVRRWNAHFALGVLWIKLDSFKRRRGWCLCNVCDGSVPVTWLPQQTSRYLCQKARGRVCIAVDQSVCAIDLQLSVYKRPLVGTIWDGHRIEALILYRRKKTMNEKSLCGSVIVT